jgi:hypothetical protein
MGKLGIGAEIIMVNMRDDGKARAKNILALPSIRINDRGMEMEEDE